MAIMDHPPTADDWANAMEKLEAARLAPYVPLFSQPMHPTMRADIDAAGGIAYLMANVTLEVLDEIHNEMDYHAVQRRAILRSIASQRTSKGVDQR